MTFAAVAVGVGGAAAIGGAYLSSSAASKAAKGQLDADAKALQLKVDKGAESQFYTDVAMFGYDAAINRLKSRYSQDYSRYVGESAADPTFNDAQRARVAEIDAQIANGGFSRAEGPAGALPWSGANRNANSAAQIAERLKSLKAEREALVKAAGGRTGTTGLWDTTTIDKTQPGIIKRLEAIGSQRQYDSKSLLADAQAIEDGLASYGKEQDAIIRRDADRQAQGLARVSRASLMGRGLGAGTAFTDVVSKGNRQIFEGMTDQLAAAGDRRLQLKTAAAGDRLNLRKSLFETDYQYQTAPINTELQYLTGPIQNNFAGENTTQYYSGASPSAASGATWGNLFSAVGGQLAGYGTQSLAAGAAGNRGNANAPNSSLSYLQGQGLIEQPGPSGIYSSGGLF